MTNAMVIADGQGEPIRVLLVDDHEHVLWGLTKLIDGEWPRMMVIGASRDIAHAALLMETRRPDVIVVDMCAGGENRLDAMRALLASPRCDVIIHTASRDDAVRRRAVLAGARCVVDKEGPADMLLREIERVHRERRLGAAP